MKLRTKSSNSSLRGELVLVASVLAMTTAALFGKVVLGGEVFLFRDAAHFYYPALQYAQQAWGESLQNGHVPLWNPDEELGRPLAADPTAALFYPGKIVFALPIEFATSYVIFTVGHVMLAAISAFFACRILRCEVYASGIAAISYAFGGSIVFQYCNVIFLVGAAWLPIGLAFGWVAVTRGSWRHGIAAACVQAMMVLGGDPQMAYYLTLILLATAIGIRRNQIETTAERASQPEWKTRCGFAFGIALLAACLSAIQIIPSWQWAVQSERNASAAAASNSINKTSAREELFAVPQAGSHRQKAYDFSIPPWRWCELLLPKISGEIFPVHRRWLTVLPASDRTWAPSLYMGMLPFILAVRRMRRPIHTLDRCLRWIVVFGVVGSLGWFGVGWLVNEALGAAGGETKYWGPVGGLYWLLNNLLPIHAQFRYPAKLWTLVACALAILSAREITEKTPLISREALQKITKIGPVVFLGMLVVIATVLWCLGPLNGATTSRLFGPLSGTGVIEDVAMSFGQLFVVCAAIIMTLRYVAVRNVQLVVLLTITSVELVVAHRSSIASADQREWQGETTMVAAIQSHALRHGIPSPRVHRAMRRGTYPETWRATSSVNRLHDGLRWDRATCAHRFGLLDGLALLRPAASFSSRAFELFINDSTEIVSPEKLSIANVGYIVGRTQDVAQYPAFKVIAQETIFDETICAAYNPAAGDRAFIQRTTLLPRDRVKIAGYSKHVVKLSVALEEQGRVVLADSFDPGWKCHSIDGESGDRAVRKIIRTDGVFRGVDLPAGEHELIFVYNPSEFPIGAALTAMTWTVLLSVGVVRRSRFRFRSQLVA